MIAGRALLAICAWIHFCLVVWVCFLLPTVGDWWRKLESAATTPLLLPLMVANLTSAWLCREQRPLLGVAAVFALIDGLAWSSRWWL